MSEKTFSIPENKQNEYENDKDDLQCLFTKSISITLSSKEIVLSLKIHERSSTFINKNVIFYNILKILLTN